MVPEKEERLQACLQELAALLYEKANKSELTDLESIEKSVRTQMLKHVSPQIALFLSSKQQEPKQVKPVHVKSCVGVLKLKAKQAQKLGLKPRSQLSPLRELCCLRLSANESYQSAEAEIEAASRRAEYSVRRTALR